MKTLIIDSHKGGPKLSNNLHLLNAKTISDYLGADLIWSYEGVNDNIKSGYDAIIFNHASHYSFVDYAWLEANPEAKLFYITNEYNLGEPRALWMAVKRGRKYDVIANHSHEPSKVVMKYVDKWNIVNLNALIHSPVRNPVLNKEGIIYHGSFRADRAKYFAKYLSPEVIVSTHQKNREKFINAGAKTEKFIDRIKWDKDGLTPYLCSIYMEDEKTHTYYNHLANRFYESLNYNVIPLFSEECLNTIELSKYPITTDLIFSNPEQIKEKYEFVKENRDYMIQLLVNWDIKAKMEKAGVLFDIKKIIYGI
ncbi:MAG: Cronobacter phage [Bacteroidota bacterium]|jgi:hypothetical protein